VYEYGLLGILHKCTKDTLSLCNYEFKQEMPGEVLICALLILTIREQTRQFLVGIQWEKWNSVGKVHVI